MWQLAGVTAAVGMGVVFIALFLLSAYMHYFKSLTQRIEGRHRPKGPTRKKTPDLPDIEPAPVASGADSRDAEGTQVAAAVAVGLHLRGVSGVAADEVAAAIATGLSLHRVRVSARPIVPTGPGSDWKLAGRMEAMQGRARRHERPFARSGG